MPLVTIAALYKRLSRAGLNTAPRALGAHHGRAGLVNFLSGLNEFNALLKRTTLVDELNKGHYGVHITSLKRSRSHTNGSGARLKVTRHTLFINKCLKQTVFSANQVGITGITQHKLTYLHLGRYTHKIGVLGKNSACLGDVDIEALTDIHNKLIELFKQTEVAIKNPTKKEKERLKLIENNISKLIKEYFDVHVKKLQAEGKYQGSVFVDAISVIELSVSKVREIRRILT